MAKRRQGTSIVIRGPETGKILDALMAPKKRFTAVDGQRCSRCGETWGRANNTKNAVYHLCLVPDASVNPLGCMCRYQDGDEPKCPMHSSRGSATAEQT